MFEKILVARASRNTPIKGVPMVFYIRKIRIAGRPKYQRSTEEDVIIAFPV